MKTVRYVGMAQKPLTVEAALTRAQKYCSFQERCTAQVLSYLKRLGIADKQAGFILKELINDGFLNDERFAGAYARGKFRNNGWGKTKILCGLRSFSISNELINRSLHEIDDEEYYHQLEKLIEKKVKAAGTEELNYAMKMQISAWAYSRGYERELISEIIKRICKY